MLRSPHAHGTAQECRFIRGQSRPEAAGAGQIPPLFRSALSEALTSTSVVSSARGRQSQAFGVQTQPVQARL